MNFKNWFNYFIVNTFIIKIIFFILSGIIIYLKLTNKQNLPSSSMLYLSHWQESSEFFFILNIGVILLYVFYPFREKPVLVGSETRLLLFVFGIIIIITNKWDLFFKENKWFYYFQRFIGGNYYKPYASEVQDEYSSRLNEESAKKQNQINYNIKKSEGMRNIQDFPNMQNFQKNNDEYQKYYTLIYPQDTVGQFGYDPPEVANAASNFSSRFPPKSSI